MSDIIENLHSVTINGRTNMSLSGVVDVKSFDEQVIIGKTEKEAFSIKGEGLHIDRLDLDTEIMEISGRIDCLSYAKAYIKNEGFFQKLMK